MSDSFDAIFDKDVEQQEVAEDLAPEIAEQEEQIAPEAEQEEAQEEAPAEEVEQEVAEVEQSTEELPEQTVPLRVLRREREEMRVERKLRQEAEAEAERLRGELGSHQPANHPTYDPYGDPQGFNAAVEQMVEQRLFSDRYTRSNEAALAKHGANVVSEAIAWGQEKVKSDPSMDHTFFYAPDPVEWVIKQHKAAQAYDEFQRDPDAYVRRRAAELAAAEQSAVTPKVVAHSTTPVEKRTAPRSITNMPATNRVATSTVRDEKADFDSLFDKR